ncbi:MAG: D-glycero-D-manno-heptose 1,7-bisphosphate phosphatase [Flavobacteriales bacterium]|jgi:D-glycero-D-manno-heptose 1,7-bisphosphate phosphatase
MNKAVFLDRDGVINHDPGDYTKNISEFTLLPTALDAMKKLHDAGYLLILITNQGGIAKGLYTHADVAEIHGFFRKKCEEHGIKITEIYYSPHHDAFGKSLSRKPGSLMIEKALARFNIDPKASVMIGDKERDLEAGSGAAVPGILIRTNAALIDHIHSLVS